MSAVLTISERILFSEGITLGIITAFAVLLVIVGILVGVVVSLTKTKPKRRQEATVEVIPLSKNEDSQIIAVLTAAVQAILNEQNVRTSFRIKSFRRTK